MEDELIYLNFNGWLKGQATHAQVLRFTKSFVFQSGAILLLHSSLSFCLPADAVVTLFLPFHIGNTPPSTH